MGKMLEISVPDIGDFEEVEVVEILVAQGDHVEVDDPLVSIESDKATMEIPSNAAGTVSELRVSEGDHVSEGTVLALLEVDSDDVAAESSPSPVGSPPGTPVETSEAPAAEARAESPVSAGIPDRSEVPAAAQRGLSRASAHPVPDRAGLPHASPLVRRYARELGVPLAETEGSGARGRVLVDDLKRHVRQRFEENVPTSPNASGSGAGIPPIPAVDFSSFGPIREEPLTRIQKVSGPGLHRSWLNVPHVTQHDEADVTELERFRKARAAEARERELKLSPLLFVMKAVVATLREFPTLRASLAPEGDRLIVKDYFHLGIAVDTDQGLMVPVVRDVDRKGIFELAAEIDDTAKRARDRKLGPDDLRGAVFTISSLGGIGGTAFSPIVNAPEVAILGLSRTRVQPVWRGPSPLDLPAAGAPPAAGALPAAGAQPDSSAPDAGLPSGRFEPRLVLPLSLSYDHRVIDGAEAVRFTTRLSGILSDPIQLLL